MADIAMLSDAPVNWRGDLLQFRRYVDPLVSVITNPHTETPFTIGIYGAWGSGKSTLLQMIDERLLDRHGDRFVRVHFNPWVHRREAEMLLPLLNALHDELAKDPRQRFTDTVKRLGAIMLNLAADELLKKLKLESMSVERIGRLAQQYAELRGQVDSQAGRLRGLLQEEADRLAGQGRTIVFFIDDLDRCEPDQIIDLLESIKLFLDLRNVFVVMALAKEVVDRGVSVKYQSFGFPPGQHAAIGDEYLDKMIQLPLHLYPLGPAEVRRFIAESRPGELAKAHVATLERIVVPNPRKIKRVLNLLQVTEAIIEASPALAALHTDLVVRLVVLRVQSPELFAEAARRPDLLVALELVHQGKLVPGSPQGFQARFKSQAEQLQELVQTSRDRHRFLADLFAGSAFEASADDLPLYLTMIGG
ncbi:KAP family P-loop NTPase fold protein [Nonomuraea pusilla]|uniref:KAP family P-loop domain-containing protein n=2 Tax=Nonomuraea pusilla TaxID=46177 RepID=A0A1H7RYP4_9ACTN|nr:KAP family P-loop domain-containing protein [Nonomuraea pusilla]